jgi:hypothetical protein
MTTSHEPPHALDDLVALAVRALIDLEAAAIGDHCLPVQLEAVLWRLIHAVLQEQLARVARLEGLLDSMLDAEPVDPTERRH